MLQIIPSFYAKCSNNSIHTKNILWATITAFRTTTPTCTFYRSADITFLRWVTLKSYSRSWTLGVSQTNTWTLSIQCSSLDSMEIVFSRMVNCLYCAKSSLFYSKKWRMQRMPTIAETRLLKKKYRKHSLSSFQKTKASKPVDKSLQKSWTNSKDKAENKKIKIVDCFLDGYGSYSSNIVTFEIKTL